MKSILFLCTLFSFQASKCQYDSLVRLKEYSVPVFYSTGHEARSQTIASRIEKALRYNNHLLKTRPEITLLILSEKDWVKYTASKLVYGMPHYTNEKTLVVAAEDNPLWKSFIPPLENLPVDLREKITSAYTTGNGTLSMQAFFDLLAIHELGHAFHLQNGLNMQRQWMGELFCNILLHTYIAENEPEALPALTVFPLMVIASGSKEYKYTSLQDIDTHYNEIGLNHPKNYGWYQSRWHKTATDIYNAGGKEILLKLFIGLKNNKEKLSDVELIKFLDASVDKSVADVIRKWETEKQ